MHFVHRPYQPHDTIAAVESEAGVTPNEGRNHARGTTDPSIEGIGGSMVDGREGEPPTIGQRRERDEA